jgi:iron(III) transport system permease protein
MPFVTLLAVSFQDAWTGSFEFHRITLENYRAIFSIEDTARRGLFNSLIISSLGATFAVIICFFLAFIIQRTRLPGRKIISFISMLPVAIPGIVLGLGFLVGFISTALYATIWIIMFAYIVHYLPTGLSNIEALVISVSHELDESSRMSGASWWQSVTKVLLPLLAPAMISTWILLFVTFIREVSASVMLYTLGTETLSIALIRIMDYKPYGISAAFGVLQTVLLMFAVIFLRFLANKTK